MTDRLPMPISPENATTFATLTSPSARDGQRIVYADTCESCMFQLRMHAARQARTTCAHMNLWQSPKPNARSASCGALLVWQEGPDQACSAVYQRSAVGRGRGQRHTAALRRRPPPEDGAPTIHRRRGWQPGRWLRRCRRATAAKMPANAADTIHRRQARSSPNHKHGDSACTQWGMSQLGHVARRNGGLECGAAVAEQPSTQTMDHLPVSGR